METVGDARAFLSATREVALAKPVIVMKPGRTAEASRAAASHTGSLTGSDEVLDAAFRRAGVLRAERISDLFYFAEVLGKQPLPRGPRLTVLSNAGGPGVLATDTLIGGGGKLAALSPGDDGGTRRASCHRRGATATPSTSSATLPRSATRPRSSRHPRPRLSDGLLVILTPQAMTDPTRTAAAAGPVRVRDGQADPRELDGRRRRSRTATGILREAGVATFPYPDSAAHLFTAARPLRREPQVPVRDPGAVR